MEDYNAKAVETGEKAVLGPWSLTFDPEKLSWRSNFVGEGITYRSGVVGDAIPMWAGLVWGCMFGESDYIKNKPKDNSVDFFLMSYGTGSEAKRYPYPFKTCSLHLRD